VGESAVEVGGWYEENSKRTQYGCVARPWDLDKKKKKKKQGTKKEKKKERKERKRERN
jgi:hypothetical protein